MYAMFTFTPTYKQKYISKKPFEYAYINETFISSAVKAWVLLIISIHDIWMISDWIFGKLTKVMHSRVTWYEDVQCHRGLLSSYKHMSQHTMK